MFHHCVHQCSTRVRCTVYRAYVDPLRSTLLCCIRGIIQSAALRILEVLLLCATFDLLIAENPLSVFSYFQLIIILLPSFSVCSSQSFYPSTSSTTSVRADSTILQEIQVLPSRHRDIAVPFQGQTINSPKRDCSSKRVDRRIRTRTTYPLIDPGS